MSAPGLYLHLPFCSAICPYCDFAVTLGDTARRARFVETLTAEIALGLPEGFPRAEIDTIYFGGGTPSLLTPEELARIVGTLGEHLPLTTQPWIGLEANPEDVDAESLAAWRGLGVRFLSLGVQSFDDGALLFLGRRHDGLQARRAVERSVAAGFDTVSLDLIYALPGQSAAAWDAQLETAAALEPDHLSCYQLTVEERTVFGDRRRRGRLAEMPDDDQSELFLQAHRRLSELGYPGYEVSNFALSRAHRSRHNRKYWDHTPYLGLGPSAHSFDGRRRWWNERGVEGWRRRLAEGERPVAQIETLTREQLALERLYLGLRTREGVDFDEMRKRYGVDLETANRDRIERWKSEGKVRVVAGRLAPTPVGLLSADSMARELELPA